jgi:hypothetical protein
VLGQRGKTWLRAVGGLLLMIAAFWPVPGQAASSGMFPPRTWTTPVIVLTSQTPMEAQLLGERPTSPPTFTEPSHLQEICPADRGGESTLQLPKNFRISFRYNRENAVGNAEPYSQAPLLFKYSMEYCLSSKLKVGLSGFLYQPPADQLSFLRQKTDMVMGWGPSVKYDLGRWSFTFQSQVSQAEKVRSDDGKDIQSWFRVWYAF